MIFANHFETALEDDSPVLERPEQIMVDLVVFLRKNIKNDQEPGRGI